MINSYIKEFLNENNVNSIAKLEDYMREMIQKLVLCGLSQTSFFQKAAFYGGTCLRIFHNINRFSENLDFTLIDENADFNWNDYIGTCVELLSSYGLAVEVYSKDEYDVGEIKRRYIKMPIYDMVKEYLGDESVNKERKISVKIELSTDCVKGATLEANTITSPILANIVCYDYPSLFAGKIGAVLTRNWRSREKGRDFYDYLFYIDNEVRINMEYLKNKLFYSLKQDMSSLTIDELKQVLLERFNNIDYKTAKMDLIRFVDSEKIDEIIKPESFMQSISKLKEYN